MDLGLVLSQYNLHLYNVGSILDTKMPPLKVSFLQYRAKVRSSRGLRIEDQGKTIENRVEGIKNLLSSLLD